MNKENAKKLVDLMHDISRMQRNIDSLQWIDRDSLTISFNKNYKEEVLTVFNKVCHNKIELRLSQKEARKLMYEIEEFLHTQLEKYEEQLEKI